MFKSCQTLAIKENKRKNNQMNAKLILMVQVNIFQQWEGTRRTKYIKYLDRDGIKKKKTWRMSTGKGKEEVYRMKRTMKVIHIMGMIFISNVFYKLLILICLSGRLILLTLDVVWLTTERINFWSKKFTWI